VRIEDLHETGNRLAHGLAIAGVQVRTQREVTIDGLSEVVLPHLTERFGQIVDDESVVIREELVAHLRDLPAREIEVQTIDERHVVAEDLRQRCEEVPCLHHDVDRLVGVAEHCDAGVSRGRLLAPLEDSRLAIGLQGRDDFFRHLLEVRDLVEPHHVPDLHQPLVPAGQVTE
jgi:hypothetical protein